MAGAYWHFYIANRYIEESSDFLKGDDRFRCILDHKKTFLSGVQGPDLNFYPGGDGNLSQLAHGDKPSDLGRELLKLAGNDRERAYAYGWLMHLTTDNIVHPLVHQLMKEHFPRQCRNGSAQDAYPIGHHRVEWGIDTFMLQTSHFIPYLSNLSEIIACTEEFTSLVSNAFREVFQYEIAEERWKGSVKGMIKYEAIFAKTWKMTGRLKDANPLKQALKETFFHTLAAPVLKLIGLKKPEGGAGVFLPIKPRPEDVESIRKHSEQVCKAFDQYLPEEFASLPNDTG
jgi:Zinc dependent phospholipase C